ncbi:hypothetical protein Tco_1131792 [Tanacetum coccineum]|uniref:Uncharacterized protein n=1 Tax=Tanacetum coccineum TaxID=301880 RepID=A0ABQ5JB69_9ASTR
MEAHCVNLELKYQNQALKEGQHCQFLKVKSIEAKVKHDINVIETINIKLEHKVAKLLKENETLKKHYKELYDSIKTTRAMNIEHATSLIAKTNDFKAQLQEKGFAIAALKNELRKLTGNSFERPRTSKPRFASQVDENNDLSKPVTTHYLPKERESAVVKPHHVIVPGSSRYSSNDMVHNHYPEEAKKQTHEIGRNSKTSVMPSVRSQSTTNVGFTLRRRIGFCMGLLQGATSFDVFRKARGVERLHELQVETLKFAAMPFGLTNAPAVFMELMSRSKEEYESHVKMIVESVKEEKIYVKFSNNVEAEQRGSYLDVEGIKWDLGSIVEKEKVIGMYVATTERFLHERMHANMVRTSIAECKDPLLLKGGQQHTEQPEFNNEGKVDQNAEQCHDIRPLPAKLTDNMTTKLSDQLLESENVCLKKTIAQFQKDFGKLEAHCINLELQLQMENNVLKSGQQGKFLNVQSNEAKVKNDIDLHKEKEHLKQTYKDLFDSIKSTRVQTKNQNDSLMEQLNKKSNENADVLAQIQKKGFAIAALKNELRKLTGNSVNTKFAKPSILGKPVGQPLKNQSVVRQPTAFKSKRLEFRKPQVCLLKLMYNNDLFANRNTFRSSTTKVESEPPNGSNADIPNQCESEQALNVSVCTLLSTGTSFNPTEEGLRVWLRKRKISQKTGLQEFLELNDHKIDLLNTAVQASVVNVKWCLLKITLQAPFLNVQKTFDHSRSSLGLHGNDVCSQQFRPRSSSNDF